MIINGGSRRAGAFFATHLMRADQNEQVRIAEMRGLAAQNLREAFREMEAVASGTKCQNYFYHANMNPRENEVLTSEQWEQAVDTLERELGLNGQPRFVVEHEKEGRTHRHVVWSRIDVDSMTAISDSLTYPKHEQAARKIEQACDLEPVESVLVKDRETPRPERNPQDWEQFRGQDSKLDPKAIKAQVTALWQTADSGAAFAAALAEHGYVLARGDRRDFCIVDQHGDEHSLARRISGAKAADVRQRMADVDAAALPSVAEAREMARQRPDGAADTPPVPEADSSSPPPETDPAPPEEPPAANAALAGEDERPPDERFGAGMAGPAEMLEVVPEPVWELPLDPPPADTAPSDEAASQAPAVPVPEQPATGFFGRLGRAFGGFFGIGRQPSLPVEQAEDLAPPPPAPGDLAGAIAEDAAQPLDGLSRPAWSGLDAPAVPALDGRREDAFASVLAVAITDAREPEQTDAGLAMPSPEQWPTAGSSSPFKVVENETISQAIADQAVTEYATAGEGTGRFGRWRVWWDNMREYVAGWREQMHEQGSHHLTSWEKEEMQERAAEEPPKPTPEPPTPTWN
jgi:hypothetical protein